MRSPLRRGNGACSSPACTSAKKKASTARRHPGRARPAGQQHRQGHPQAGRHGHHLQRAGPDLDLPVQPVQPGGQPGVARLRLRAAGLRQPAASNEAETPMLASSYTWSADKKSIVFTIRDGVKWSDGQPFTAADVAFTFNLMKKVPGDRPLRAVDRRRAAERHRQRQQGHDDLRQAGQAVLLQLRQPGRHRAASTSSVAGAAAAHPDTWPDNEPGRHRAVHGQPVQRRTTSSTPPTRPTGSRASRTSRRSSTRPTWTTGRPTSTWPTARRSGAASSSRTSRRFYLAKSGDNHTWSPPVHERRASSRTSTRRTRATSKLGGAAGDRLRPRPHADRHDRRGRPAAAGQPEPASSCPTFNKYYDAGGGRRRRLRQAERRQGQAGCWPAPATRRRTRSS